MRKLLSILAVGAGSIVGVFGAPAWASAAESVADATTSTASSGITIVPLNVTIEGEFTPVTGDTTSSGQLNLQQDPGTVKVTSAPSTATTAPQPTSSPTTSSPTITETPFMHGYLWGPARY